MEKPAPTRQPVLNLISNRWSPLAFDPGRPVDDKSLLSLLEAARWAPSSFNEQPWAFILARRADDKFPTVLDCLVPGNQRWARDAPVLIITVAKHNFEKNGKPNRHAMHDIGTAMAWLTVQAESMGLQVHQMSGIDIEKCRTNLGIPDGWEPATGVAIGWPGKSDQLPDDLKARETSPRTRKELSQVVFHGKWGEKPKFLA